MAANKFVLITGCSQGGIGDALAQEFHANQCKVFASARNLTNVRHLVQMGIEVLQLDVGDDNSITQAVIKVMELTEGKLDFLVNNASIGYQAAMIDVHIPEAKSCFDINFWAVLKLTQSFIPALVEAQGCIINIGSVAGKAPMPFQGLYGASKAALHSMSDNMRIELQPLGVKVINVVGGGFKTSFYKNNPAFRLPDDSFYISARHQVEPILKGEISQANSHCTPEEAAKQIVKIALNRSPSPEPWIGSKVLLVWFLRNLFWHTFIDRILLSLFGLSHLKLLERPSVVVGAGRAAANARINVNSPDAVLPQN